jgi:hypothetical protein
MWWIFSNSLRFAFSISHPFYQGCVQLTKSDREISTTEGNFLLPLRHSRHERHNKLTAISRPDPYRFDNDFLDDVLTNDAIHYPEHQARYRREVSTKEKAHVAYGKYKQDALGEGHGEQFAP